jgi:hypothetical protein
MPQQDLNYPTDPPSIEMGVVTQLVRDDEVAITRGMFLHCGWVTLGFIQKLIVTDPSLPSGTLDPATDTVACAAIDSLAAGTEPSSGDLIPLWRWLKERLDGALLTTEE